MRGTDFWPTSSMPNVIAYSLTTVAEFFQLENQINLLIDLQIASYLPLIK